MAALAAQAAKAGARLILFGEGALTGYLLTPEILAQAVEAGSPVVARLRDIARRYRIVLVPGTIECSPAGLHMSQFVVYPEGQLVIQRKANLTDDERKANLVPGAAERVLFQVDGVTMAIGICADNGLENIHAQTRARGCQLYLWPAAGGGSRDSKFAPADLKDPQKRKKYEELMHGVAFPAFAIKPAAELGLAIASCNLCGDDGVGKYHPGHSAIVDCHGRLRALECGQYVAEFLAPCLIHAEVELA